MITGKLFKEPLQYAEGELAVSQNSILSTSYLSEMLHHDCFEFFSLKKGRISSITHQLPEVCPFASYEELRKHWKLMVGRVRICTDIMVQKMQGKLIFTV